MYSESPYSCFNFVPHPGKGGGGGFIQSVAASSRPTLPEEALYQGTIESTFGEEEEALYQGTSDLLTLH